MSLITLEEAKIYLRVDTTAEDGLIDGLILSAEKICMDVGRLTTSEWDILCDETTETMTIRGSEMPSEDVLHLRSLMKTAILYALGYLYEHREEADHHDLTLTLRSLLFAIREGAL